MNAACLKFLCDTIKHGITERMILVLIERLLITLAVIGVLKMNAANLKFLCDIINIAVVQIFGQQKAKNIVCKSATINNKNKKYINNTYSVNLFSTKMS